jgi:energy-coupling factor transporter ATP-binding protein EcfA2
MDATTRFGATQLNRDFSGPNEDPMTYVGRILLDVPAKDPSLGFTQIAQALSQIVQTSEPRFAVGIFGGWGSGKSTLMEEIEQLISKDRTAMVVRFNAWRYERESHLIIPLLDTIRSYLAAWAAQLEHADERKKATEITRKIGQVVRALVRATTIEIGVPSGPTLSLEPGKALDELLAQPDDVGSSAQSLYFGAFQQLTSAFSDVREAGLSRIVVFVDDLDRCLPQQSLTVLESMKLFFDMPGFIFVVGLDERVVESAVRTKFAEQPGGTDVDRQLERDYLKKMFQVPYTLPPMMAGQLDDLLQWLIVHGELAPDQRADLNARVRDYLRYVATEGRINPREVKRYINAYTLNRMVRPDLEPDTMLALQTIDFRSDWERIYEEAILAEPDVFVDTLKRFRSGEDTAFEDMWPDLGVLPLGFSGFLRSQEAQALSDTPDLGRYLSFMETTRSTAPWITEAMRDVGQLRAPVRALNPGLRFGSSRAREMAEKMKDSLGRLSSYTTSNTPTLRSQPLNKLNELINVLAPSGSLDSPPHETTPEQLQEWRDGASGAIDDIQSELRDIRQTSAFSR